MKARPRPFRPSGPCASTKSRSRNDHAESEPTRPSTILAVIGLLIATPAAAADPSVPDLLAGILAATGRVVDATSAETHGLVRDAADTSEATVADATSRIAPDASAASGAAPPPAPLQRASTPPAAAPAEATAPTAAFDALAWGATLVALIVGLLGVALAPHARGRALARGTVALVLLATAAALAFVDLTRGASFGLGLVGASLAAWAALVGAAFSLRREAPVAHAPDDAREGDVVVMRS